MEEARVEERKPESTLASFPATEDRAIPLRVWGTSFLYVVSLVLVDCLAILGAFLVAFFFRILVLPEFISGVDPIVPVEPYIETPWLVLCWPAVFYYEGLYERGLGNWDELLRLSKSVLFGSLLVMGATFISHTSTEYSRPILVGTFISSLFLVPIVRTYFKKRFLFHLFPIRVLLFTGPSDENKVASHLTILHECGYQPLKTLPVSNSSEEDALRDQVYLSALEWDPDEMILVQGELDEEALRKLLRCLESTSRPVRVVSSLTVFQLRASIRNLDGLLLYDLNSGLSRPFSRMLKRGMDIVVALLLLILCAPLFLMIGILIKLDSRGPVFFSHRRLDCHGRVFRCLKFRTMLDGAERRLQQWKEQGDPRGTEFQAAFKLKDDPRITRVGKWLRKTSLDELPQLIHVLRGTMSLVGPRPPLVEEVEAYGKDFQYLRMVKGGMTGLWQISGRNDTDYSERIALNTYYVRTWSIWVDLIILVKTIGVVLRRSGAY